jgi:hypothetical protein
MNVEDHKLQPIGAMPLHPVEAMIVAAVTDAGQWVRQCSCRILVNGNNELDMFCNYKSHLADVARAARG